MFKSDILKKVLKSKLTETSIKFHVNEKDYKFEFLHNLFEFNLDISDAFQNWIVRTKKISCKSFCKYVASKDPGIICIVNE